MTAHRFSTQETADIEIYGRGDLVKTVMRNLSMTGAFFEVLGLTKSPNPGDILHITIHLKGLSRKRKLDAEVVWTSGRGLGVQFIKADDVMGKMLARSS